MSRRGLKWTGLSALLTGTVVATSCVASSPAGAALVRPARAAMSGASHPTWHVVYRLPRASINSVVAAGPKSAWAAANFWDRKGVPHGQLLHWNGVRWRLVQYPDQRTNLIYGIFALSATDVWFSVNGSGNAELLHWRNGSWSTMALPVNAQNPLVLSDSDIWVAGGDLPGCYSVTPDSRGCAPTSHWDGKRWRSYPLRAYYVDGFGSSSSSNVWAVAESWEREKPLGHNRGSSISFRPFVFRWTRAAWQRTSLSLPRTNQAPSVVVRSAHDVFVADTTKAHPTACGMRWNGTRWAPFFERGSRGPCYWAISDYRRGLWLYGPPGPGFSWVHWTGTRFVTTVQFFPSKNGWDTNGFTVAAVPHSSSVWLFGSYACLTRGCKFTGVIAALR